MQHNRAIHNIVPITLPTDEHIFNIKLHNRTRKSKLKIQNFLLLFPHSGSATSNMWNTQQSPFSNFQQFYNVYLLKNSNSLCLLFTSFLVSQKLKIERVEWLNNSPISFKGLHPLPFSFDYLLRLIYHLMTFSSLPNC